MTVHLDLRCRFVSGSSSSACPLAVAVCVPGPPSSLCRFLVWVCSGALKRPGLLVGCRLGAAACFCCVCAA